MKKVYVVGTQALNNPTDLINIINKLNIGEVWQSPKNKLHAIDIDKEYLEPDLAFSTANLKNTVFNTDKVADVIVDAIMENREDDLAVGMKSIIEEIVVPYLDDKELLIDDIKKTSKKTNLEKSEIASDLKNKIINAISDRTKDKNLELRQNISKRIVLAIVNDKEEELLPVERNLIPRYVVPLLNKQNLTISDIKENSELTPQQRIDALCSLQEQLTSFIPNYSKSIELIKMRDIENENLLPLFLSNTNSPVLLLSTDRRGRDRSVEAFLEHKGVEVTQLISVQKSKLENERYIIFDYFNNVKKYPHNLTGNKRKKAIETLSGKIIKGKKLDKYLKTLTQLDPSVANNSLDVDFFKILEDQKVIYNDIVDLGGLAKFSGKEIARENKELLKENFKKYKEALEITIKDPEQREKLEKLYTREKIENSNFETIAASYEASFKEVKGNFYLPNFKTLEDPLILSNSLPRLLVEEPIPSKRTVIMIGTETMSVSDLRYECGRLEEQGFTPIPIFHLVVSGDCELQEDGKLKYLDNVIPVDYSLYGDLSDIKDDFEHHEETEASKFSRDILSPIYKFVERIKELKYKNEEGIKIAYSHLQTKDSETKTGKVIKGKFIVLDCSGYRSLTNANLNINDVCSSKILKTEEAAVRQYLIHRTMAGDDKYLRKAQYPLTYSKGEVFDTFEQMFDESTGKDEINNTPTNENAVYTISEVSKEGYVATRDICLNKKYPIYGDADYKKNLLTNNDFVCGIYNKDTPNKKLLNASFSSRDKFSNLVNPYNLVVDYNSNNFYPIENVFLASEVFKNGGPYKDLLTMKAKDARKDPRITDFKEFEGYYHKGMIFFSSEAQDLYNYLFASALKNTESEIAKKLLTYDAFFDGNQTANTYKLNSSISLAVYKGLVNQGLLEKALENKKSFLECQEILRSRKEVVKDLDKDFTAVVKEIKKKEKGGRDDL